MSKDYRQLLHWQPVKIRVFSFLLKDDKLGAILTEGGSLFQMREMTNEYEYYLYESLLMVVRIIVI